MSPSYKNSLIMGTHQEMSKNPSQLGNSPDLKQTKYIKSANIWNQNYKTEENSMNIQSVNQTTVTEQDKNVNMDSRNSKRSVVFQKNNVQSNPMSVTSVGQSF